ncbi:uncharacterized protein LOC144107517 isoform X2 [Amblyomma americanum]
MKDYVRNLEGRLQVAEERLQVAENNAESFPMVKKTNKLFRRLQALDEAPRQADVPKADTEDIWGGVMVEKTVISRLHAHCQGLPTKFARSLFLHLFTEELRGKSLYGKVIYAHKKGPARDGLYPVRLNAALGYRCGRFPATPLLQLKNSLSSMLSLAGNHRRINDKLRGLRGSLCQL